MDKVDITKLITDAGYTKSEVQEDDSIIKYEKHLFTIFYDIVNRRLRLRLDVGDKHIQCEFTALELVKVPFNLIFMLESKLIEQLNKM